MILFFFGIFISLVPRSKILITSLFFSLSLFTYTLILWCFINPLSLKFATVYTLYIYKDWPLIFGIDSYAYFLILLTTFIFPLCFLTVESSITHNVRTFYLLLILLEFLIIFVFLSLDFLSFYLLFEISLIPMFLMIGFWGGHFRKTKAAYYLFLYTFFGSLFMLIAIIYFFSQFGTTNYFVLIANPLNVDIQLILWPAIFFAFAIKVPMFPFHVWLPEAHVEAPTIGSVLLAALVLKLGGFGFLRFLLPILPLATDYYTPMVQTLALLGAIYAALTALRQLDLKRIIAYSSIAHMNVGILGLFSLSFEGIGGFYYVMLGHGLISSGLFFLVGVLYDRYHTRFYFYYTGLVTRMPLFSSMFFFFTVANVAFPGTINFFSEVLILFGITKLSVTLTILTTISLFVSTIYAFWLFNRICFGTINIVPVQLFYDLTRQEFYIFVFLSYVILLGGLFPNNIFQLIYNSTLFLLPISI